MMRIRMRMRRMMKRSNVVVLQRLPWPKGWSGLPRARCLSRRQELCPNEVPSSKVGSRQRAQQEANVLKLGAQKKAVFVDVFVASISARTE